MTVKLRLAPKARLSGRAAEELYELVAASPYFKGVTIVYTAESPGHPVERSITAGSSFCTWTFTTEEEFRNAEAAIAQLVGPGRGRR